MKNFFISTVLGLLLAFGVTGSATTLTVNSYILQAGVTNYGGTGGEFGAYLNGNPATVIDVYCVDFADVFSWGTLYNSLSVSTGTNVANTLLGNNTSWYSSLGGATNDTYNGQDRYAMAAYLTTLYAPPSSPANDAIQLAIWEIVDKSTSLNNYNSAAAADVTQAVNWFNSLTTPQLTAFEGDITIYTDAPQGMQEFVSVTPWSPVPEPSSLVLVSMGGALIGLGALRRRRPARK
jgi:hypothetical protein